MARHGTSVLTGRIAWLQRVFEQATAVLEQDSDNEAEDGANPVTSGDGEGGAPAEDVAATAAESARRRQRAHRIARAVAPA